MELVVLALQKLIFCKINVFHVLKIVNGVMQLAVCNVKADIMKSWVNVSHV
jgi:hypothetical protein